MFIAFMLHIIIFMWVHTCMEYIYQINDILPYISIYIHFHASTPHNLDHFLFDCNSTKKRTENVTIYKIRFQINSN